MGFHIKHITSILKQAILLGLYSEKELKDATFQYYKRQSQYQNETYNLSGLLSWEEKVIDNFFPKRAKIIIAGSGGGREAIALKRKGFDVVASECNENLVHAANQLARKNNINIYIKSTKPDTIPTISGLRNSGFVGWGAYMHIIGAGKRVLFLQKIRRNLSPGSPILLSFFTRKPSSKTFITIYYLAKLIQLIRQSKQRIELGDSLNGSFDHYFTEDEISLELQQAGFQLLFFTEQPYGHAVALAN